MGFNNGGPFAHEGTYDKKTLSPHGKQTEQSGTISTL